MKKILLSVSSVIVLILMIAAIMYYQKPTELAYPYFKPPDENLDIQPSLNETEQPQEMQLQAIHPDESISYTLQNDELNITFNHGQDWAKVPITKEALFSGEYQGNKQELIENSYILTEDRAGFLYSDEVEEYRENILFLYSIDQGETWKESVVTDHFFGMRFRKVDFLNDHFGYIIISGGRTMSQESSHVFLTHDGGETWEETTNSGNTRLIADGGFVDESTGFLSYGTINPEAPDFYVTQDGGITWQESVIHIPEELQLFFVQAEVPVKEDDHLSLLVNQGPNGDYKGGKVKGKFISTDNGATWEFQTEVQPNE